MGNQGQGKEVYFRSIHFSAITIMALLFFLLPTSCKTTSSTKGLPAPNFADLDLYQKPFDLADYRNNKNVVLVFYVDHA
jgi:hypothetical protein